MKKQKIYWLFLLPSLLGVLLFYCIPFLCSFYYAMIDNMGAQNFVGLKNFEETLSNQLFQSASKNTIVFIGISVPLGMIIALILALCLQPIRQGRTLAVMALLLPIVVPSGTIVYFWRMLFDSNGLLAEMLVQVGVPYETLIQHDGYMVVLVIVFLWKNVSYNIILFWSGLNWIPKTYYEQMEMEGANRVQQFCRVTWIYLSPTTYVVLLLSIVNSFKVFKEVYLLYGAYPSESVYMLQHYMNNQFATMNMPKLASAAYILFLAI